MPEHDDERGGEAVLRPPRAFEQVHGAEEHVDALGVRGRLADDFAEELLAALKEVLSRRGRVLLKRRAGDEARFDEREERPLADGRLTFRVGHRARGE